VDEAASQDARWQPRTQKSCGSGTPGLVLSLPDVWQATVTNKVMDTGKSTKDAVKTIAQGMSGLFG